MVISSKPTSGACRLEYAVVITPGLPVTDQRHPRPWQPGGTGSHSK